MHVYLGGHVLWQCIWLDVPLWLFWAWVTFVSFWGVVWWLAGWNRSYFEVVLLGRNGNSILISCCHCFFVFWLCEAPLFSFVVDALLPRVALFTLSLVELDH